jgi:rhodanese-related sulfurtransferase
MSKIFGILSLLYFASVALVFGAAYKNLPSTEVKKMMEQKKNIFLLDVRTPDEYRQGHIKGAVLIPIGEIERRLAEVPRNRPVVTYCAVGSRSSLVSGFLAGKGYNETYNMQDGIMGWSRNGLQVEK